MDPDNNLISACGTTDRLSNLPGNIIDEILNLLPLKEAARTSVLSKNWEDKWLTIPHLFFEEHTSESVIYHVLRLHKGPIVWFAIVDTHIEDQTDLYNLFNLLSKHRIEELMIMLDSYIDEPLHVMPCHLFSFYNLKNLYLREVEVKLPLSMYNGFSNLISINFGDVIIEVEELQRLIDKCPKLESMTLLDCFKVTNLTLHISTPRNLKSFRFEGKVDFMYICTNPHLEDVRIYYKHSLNTESDTVLDYAIKFFGQLSMIKKLQVNCDFLKVLARSVPSMLPKSLSHLNHIQFDRTCTDSVDYFKSALCLIRSSPNLQSIVIRVHFDCECDHVDDEDDLVEYLKEEQKSAVPLSGSLKEVKMHCFSGFAPEMEFVKLLFLGAVELRKVELTGVSNETQLGMRKTLESFRRSSSQKIILSDDYDA